MEKRKYPMSSFIYDTALSLEKLVEDQTRNIQEHNKYLQGKILQWYQQTKDEDFANHFNITSQEEGTIKAEPTACPIRTNYFEALRKEIEKPKDVDN